MKTFRETLWFKRHELDTDIPEESSDRDRPIEDRYADDETITREDAAQFSLRTGTTACIAVVKPARRGATADTLPALVRELKSHRRHWVALAGAMAMVCALLLIAL